MYSVTQTKIYYEHSPNRVNLFNDKTQTVFSVSLVAILPISDAFWIKGVVEGNETGTPKVGSIHF